MIIGIPRETHRHEHRVGLTPAAVHRLVRRGHGVVVEREAGAAAHFTDCHYEKAGAQVVYSQEEAYRRADLVCRVGQMADDEVELVRPGSTLCAFHHLAVAPRERVERLMELEVTLIGYEVIRDDGELPVLLPLSELAGQMVVQIAGHLLQNESGGRGILLGNAPGVPPPTMLILGAGTVGRTAARQALAAGAHVIVIDSDLSKLRRLNHELEGRVVTVLAGEERLERYTGIADVVVGAILIPGGRAPFLVTEEMVRAMKPGSVLLDISIDQGGCVATSRPTTLADPTFIAHGVVHYCVPNMTANIARTASRALADACLPYISALADAGLEASLGSDPALASGVVLYRGRMVHQAVGETLGLSVESLSDLLG